jgi:hypothetical protein
MKQFDRPFLEEYRRIPKGNNILYQNYSNPSAQGQSMNAPVQNVLPTQAQAPVQSNQIIERWPEEYRGLLPKNMQGYDSAQVLQELQKAYQGNQNLTNQRTLLDKDFESQNQEVDRKGKEEFSRLQTLHNLLENYPNTANDTAIRTTWRLHGKTATPTTLGATRIDTSGKGDADLRVILATPNKTVKEANEALKQMYGNKYNITYDPILAQKYGYALDLPNIPVNQQPNNPIIPQVQPVNEPVIATQLGNPKVRKPVVFNPSRANKPTVTTPLLSNSKIFSTTNPYK